MNNYRSGFFSSIPPVVKNLLILNVLIFFISWVVEGSFGYDLNRQLGLYYPDSVYFRPYQFITHMFMHGGFMHIFFNMFALWMFGRVLETVWGPRRFFIYYMIVGLGAATFYTLVNWVQFSMITNAANEILSTGSPDQFMSLLKTHFSDEYRQLLNSDFVNDWYKNPHNAEYAKQAYDFVSVRLVALKNIPTVGASGAVFGVLLAFGMMFPNTQLMLLFPPIPIKAKYFVIIYGALELYLGITQPGSHVAHFAHIGGMIFGFILIKYWNRGRSNFY